MSRAFVPIAQDVKNRLSSEMKGVGRIDTPGGHPVQSDQG